MAAEDENPARGGRPLRKQGEEAIGKFAQELLQSPVVSGALTTVFETRERATRAQEVAMSALNLPSAADIERLTRRLRSVAQRIEGVEDSLDRMTDKLEKIGSVATLEGRLEAIETMLARIEESIAALAVDGPPLAVDGPPPAEAPFAADAEPDASDEPSPDAPDEPSRDADVA
jgi:UrcA family protein